VIGSIQVQGVEGIRVADGQPVLNRSIQTRILMDIGTAQREHVVPHGMFKLAVEGEIRVFVGFA
jgi:hypothetical protein